MWKIRWKGKMEKGQGSGAELVLEETGRGEEEARKGVEKRGRGRCESHLEGGSSISYV